MLVLGGEMSAVSRVVYLIKWGAEQFLPPSTMALGTFLSLHRYKPGTRAAWRKEELKSWLSSPRTLRQRRGNEVLQAKGRGKQSSFSMARRTVHSLGVPSQFVFSHITPSLSPGTPQSSLTSVQPKTERFSQTEPKMNPRTLCLKYLSLKAMENQNWSGHWFNGKQEWSQRKQLL